MNAATHTTPPAAQTEEDMSSESHVAGLPVNFGANYEHADENVDGETLQYRLESLEQLYEKLIARVARNRKRIERLEDDNADLHTRALKVQERVNFIESLKTKRGLK